jgi:hypothetical protein
MRRLRPTAAIATATAVSLSRSCQVGGFAEALDDPEFLDAGLAGMSHSRKLAIVIKLPRIAAIPPTQAIANQIICCIQNSVLIGNYL